MGLTCQRRKSERRETPEVRMRMSSGGEAEVYMFELTVCSVMSLLWRERPSARRGRIRRERDNFGWRQDVAWNATHLGSISPATQPSTVRFMAVAISSCDVYGQQKFKMPLHKVDQDQISATMVGEVGGGTGPYLLL